MKVFNGGVFGDHPLTAENLEKQIKFCDFVDNERNKLGLTYRFNPIFKDDKIIAWDNGYKRIKLSK